MKINFPIFLLICGYNRTMFSHPFFRLLFIVLVIVAVLVFLGLFLFWYWRIPEFDLLVHFLGGVWSGGMAIWFSRSFKVLRVFLSAQKNVYILSIVAVFIIGIGWEIFEILAGNSVIGEDGFWMDTVTDLIADLFGAWAIAYYFLAKRYDILENNTEFPQT